MATGWGVERANNKGFDTGAARQINAAEYSVGVLRGCKISTSSTNLTYTVSRGSDPASIAVGSATAADGAVIFPVPDGLTTGAVAAGDPTNPRIDSIYAVQHDAAAGDADNQVVLVAVSGTPAASPTPPAAPAGIAVKLASFMVPKSASTTSQATSYGNVDFSVPYGASLGDLITPYQDVWNGQFDGSTVHTLGAAVFYLPTKRNVDFDYYITMSNGPAGSSSTEIGSVLVTFYLDGVAIAANEISYTFVWETKPFHFRAKNVAPGNHAVHYTIEHRAGAQMWQHYGDAHAIGSRFSVTDAGVAQ